MDKFVLKIECSVGISELNIKFSQGGEAVVTATPGPSSSVEVPSAPTQRQAQPMSSGDPLADRAASRAPTPTPQRPAAPVSSGAPNLPDVEGRPPAADKDFVQQF